MAQKYLAQKIDEATEEQLFAEAIAQLEEAQWPN